MLIRSQDKKKIINFDNYDGIAISYESENDFALCAVKEVDAERVSHSILGNYKTEQKCLDIMDEICLQRQMAEMLLAVGKSSVEPAFVYDMPEEECDTDWIPTPCAGVYTCPLCKTTVQFDIGRGYTPEKCPVCGGFVRRG